MPIEKTHKMCYNEIMKRDFNRLKLIISQLGIL